MNRPADRMPLLAGLVATRANLVPGALIQAAMLGMVLAYYYHAPTRHALDTLAGWKRQYGYGFTFVLLGLTGGVLPEALKVTIFQRGSPRRANFDDMAFGFVLWGFMGCCTDTFYRYQALWFGSEVTATTIMKKVAVDMLVYTPLWGTPAVVWMHAWRRTGFSSRAGWLFTPRFYRSTIFPTLIANWGVWIPAVTIIYSLPLLLQVPLFALATSFWSLLVTYMTSGKPVPVELPST